jgi:hypothetical protein
LNPLWLFLNKDAVIDGSGTYKKKGERKSVSSELFQQKVTTTEDSPPMQLPVVTVIPSVDRSDSAQSSRSAWIEVSSIFDDSTCSPPRSRRETLKPPFAIVSANGHPPAPALWTKHDSDNKHPLEQFWLLRFCEIHLHRILLNLPYDDHIVVLWLL